MKRVISKLSLSAAVALACAASAHAADGTITITGQVTDITCNVAVGGGGKDYTVTLPTVSVNSLKLSGDTAGATPFDIALSGCTNVTASNTASTWFEPGANVDSTTGRLINSGDAQNVQVELLNKNMNPINAGSSAQNDVPSSISGGNAILNYYARYHATGAATAGAVTTSVQYTIVYQ